LLKVIDINEDGNHRVIVKGADKKITNGISVVGCIQQINKVMKDILGSAYSSHSFRQGFRTEMGSKSINTKIISKAS